MISLKRMNDSEFKIFDNICISELSAVFETELPPGQALKKAEVEQRDCLPNGLSTDGHHFYSIYEGENFLGGLWFTRIKRDGSEFAFLFFIWINPDSRSAGAGNSAMSLLEQKVSDIGLSSIRLHVLKTNKAALQMYKKLGYREFKNFDSYSEESPGIIMLKNL